MFSWSLRRDAATHRRAGSRGLRLASRHLPALHGLHFVHVRLRSQAPLKQESPMMLCSCVVTPSLGSRLELSTPVDEWWVVESLNRLPNSRFCCCIGSADLARFLDQTKASSTAVMACLPTCGFCPAFYLLPVCLQLSCLLQFQLGLADDSTEGKDLVRQAQLSPCGQNAKIRPVHVK